MAALNSPIEPVAAGVRVALRVTPKASRADIGGVGLDAAGRAFLKVRVTAPPEDGKANTAVVKLLAKAWNLPRSGLRLVAGGKDRRKTLLVEGDPAELGPRLEAWLREIEKGAG